jgi:adenylyltransferase/sulfurtransferase
LNSPPDVPELTVTDLKQRVDRGEDLVVVDVREPFERKIADLPWTDQIRVPLAELEGEVEILEEDGHLDRNETVVVYCRSGARSAMATRLLRDRGFEDAFNLKGGILAWREEIDPSLRAY